MITELQAGSAIATVTAQTDFPDIAESVVRGYGEIGYQLARREPISRKPNIRTKALAIPELINERITGIRLYTPLADVLIESAEQGSERPHYVLGSVRGKVETISVHNGLRFTLYEVLFGRAVLYYASEEQRELVHAIWDKQVMVSGLIARNSKNGYPVSIKEITSIESLYSSQQGDFEKGRGLFQLDTEQASEAIIRGVREPIYVE